MFFRKNLTDFQELHLRTFLRTSQNASILRKLSKEDFRESGPYLPKISRCKKTGRKLSGYSNLMPLQQDYRPVWQLQGRFCALKGPSACWEREQLQSWAFKFKSLKEQTMSLHLGLANTYALPAGEWPFVTAVFFGKNWEIDTPQNLRFIPAWIARVNLIPK